MTIITRNYSGGGNGPPNLFCDERGYTNRFLLGSSLLRITTMVGREHDNCKDKRERRSGFTLRKQLFVDNKIILDFTGC